jgi:hypothetical protein
MDKVPNEAKDPLAERSHMPNEADTPNEAKDRRFG